MKTDRVRSMLERLKAHQDRVLDVAARAEAILACNDPATAPALAQSRWEMMRALMPYSAFKHGEMFPTMLRDARPDHMGKAERLRTECLTLGADVKAYVARWSSVNVPDHWAEFRPAARDMLIRVRAHMAREMRMAEEILLASLPAASRVALSA